jgi:hypothetical protein
MIEITYTHIYMIIPTPGLRKTCHPSTKNKYSKDQRDFSSCILAKGERGHRKKVYAQEA